MKALIAILFILAITACSTQPLTEEEQYLRDDKEIQRIEQYHVDKANCTDAGGIWFIKGHNLSHNFRRNKIPSRSTKYGCMSRWDFNRLFRQISGRY